MSSLPPTPWIHIGECPLCVNGLCRIRSCEDEQGRVHLYAMCDECEAIWTEPNTDTKKVYPKAVDPLCPICARPLFGPQAHWAQPEEVTREPNWSVAAIFELPSSLEQPISSDLLVMEDIATDLDAPATPEFDESEDDAIDFTASDESLADSSYGQDDPKPGC